MSTRSHTVGGCRGWRFSAARLLWGALLFLGALSTGSATTAAGAGSFTYDALDVARVDVIAFGAGETTRAGLSGGQEASVSVSAGRRRTSTTVIPSVVATKAASGSGALRSVNEVLDGLPKGNQSWVRMVPDEGSLTTKFNELTEGGTPTTWKNFDGAVIERGDGVEVGLRGSSSSGGGAIDIRMPDGSRIRVHVEQP